MFVTATAADTASFGIKIPDHDRVSEYAAKVVERYMRWFVNRSLTLSETKPEAFIKSPTLIAPQWLAAVQERIDNSIIPKGQEVENDGRWLSADVVDTAAAFFQMSSDLLPGEPHIYGVDGGDLVAEFDALHGTMTSIVTPTFVLVFAVVDKRAPIEKRFTFGSDSPTKWRRELQQLTEMLRTGQHGSMEAAR